MTMHARMVWPIIKGIFFFIIAVSMVLNVFGYPQFIELIGRQYLSMVINVAEVVGYWGSGLSGIIIGVIFAVIVAVLIIGATRSFLITAGVIMLCIGIIALVVATVASLVFEEMAISFLYPSLCVAGGIASIILGVIGEVLVAFYETLMISIKERRRSNEQKT